MESRTRRESRWGNLLALCRRLPVIGWVLLLAGLLRATSVLLLRNYLHPETWEYGPIARSVNAGLGYTQLLADGKRIPSAFMPPGYPYLLALFYEMGGERSITYFVIEILQAALGVATVYVVYRTALILMGEKGAMVAAVLIAVFPSQVYLCNEIHSISIYILLECASVFYLVRYLSVDPSRRDLILSGLCMGALMYFRTESPALLIAFAGILVLLRGKKALGHAAIYVLIGFACIAPWTVRNWVEFGKFVPISTSSGYNLWVGNNPLATGSQHNKLLAQTPSDLKEALDRISHDRVFEVEMDNSMRHLAYQFAFNHPRAEAVLMTRKLFLFFVFDPEHEKGSMLVYWLPSVILTLFALHGAYLRRKKLLMGDLPITISILAGVAVAVVAVVLPRYKMIIDPFLILYAANSIASMGLFKRQRAWGAAAHSLRSVS